MACTLVLCTFAAIVVTLVVVDGRPLPNMPFHVSINTLVAICSTIVKIAAAFVLAEGISQAKWAWYRKPHNFRDFLFYDNASRGPWGAAQLIWYLRCRPLVASLGALITIIAALIDPLSQKLIKLNDCNITLFDEEVSLPRTQLYDEGSTSNPFLTGSAPSLALGFLGSMSTGQFSSTAPQVPFSCSSGNCTFTSNYSSIGYCSDCQDISSNLEINNSTLSSDGTVPPGVTIGLGDGSISLTTYGCGGNSCFSVGASKDDGVSMIWFDGYKTSDLLFTPPDTSNIFAHAYKCTIQPCPVTFATKISVNL